MKTLLTALILLLSLTSTLQAQCIMADRFTGQEVLTYLSCAPLECLKLPMACRSDYGNCPACDVCPEGIPTDDFTFTNDYTGLQGVLTVALQNQYNLQGSPIASVFKDPRRSFLNTNLHESLNHYADLVATGPQFVQLAEVSVLRSLAGDLERAKVIQPPWSAEPVLECPYGRSGEIQWLCKQLQTAGELDDVDLRKYMTESVFVVASASEQDARYNRAVRKAARAIYRAMRIDGHSRKATLEAILFALESHLESP